MTLSTLLRCAFVGGLSLSGGLLAWGALDVVRSAAARLRLYRTRSRLILNSARERERAFDPVGLEGVPWEALRALSALVGMGLAAALFWERSPYLVVLGLTAGYAPSMARSYLARRRRQILEAEVRHFLRFLHSASQLYGGMMPALRAIAEHSQDDAAVVSRLRARLSVAQTAGEILEGLARDLQSEALGNLVSRMEEAAEGRVRPEEALERLLARAEREVVREAKEAIGGAPIRLLIPMLILMVPPILVLTLYPAVARLMELIAGTGTAPLW